MENHKIGQERALGVIVADSSKNAYFYGVSYTSSCYLVAVSRPVAQFSLATVNKMRVLTCGMSAWSSCYDPTALHMSIFP